MDAAKWLLAACGYCRPVRLHNAAFVDHEQRPTASETLFECAMEEDTKQDYEELKRQDRKFLWGLVAFVLTTCIGGILYLVNQAPNLATKDSPIPPNDPIVKRLADEEANRVKAKTALEELV